MSLPIDFMRGLVGVIGIGCAFMLARSAVAVGRGQARLSKLYGWLIRLTLCVAAVWYPVRGSVDTVDLSIWVLSAAAFGVSYWESSREKKDDDLTREIFPDSGEDS